MAVKGLGWILLPLGLAAAQAAVAEDVTFTCPVTTFKPYRDPGMTGEVAIVLRGGDPGSVEMHGALGDITVPAQTIMIDKDTVVGQAAGQVEMRMPDRRVIDACIATEEKKHPGIMRSRRGDEVIGACRTAAPLTAQPVATRVTVALMATSPPQGQLLLKRDYADEEGDIARLHGAYSMGSCTLASP